MGDLMVTKHPNVYSKAGDKVTSELGDHMTIADRQDFSHDRTANGCGNSEENSSSHSESTEPRTNVDNLWMDRDNRTELSRHESRFDKVSDIYKSDGLQELLQFAQEFELEEALQDISCKKSHDHTEGLKKEGDLTGANKFSSLGTKESRDKINNKCAGVLCQGDSTSNGTVQDEKSPCQGRSQDIAVSNKALGSNGTSGDTCLRTHEISETLGSKLLAVEKALCSKCVKNYEDSLKKLSIHAIPEHHDEDDMSISSIKSCSPVPKAKASRCTSATSFKFHTDGRAEKRKEYYAKLQERQIAKEKKMNQLQVKAKKDREEEIKNLRKSLTFKAHPVPSFYQEGPPQKAELPKTPTTRAKSPNFSRRETNFRGSTRYCNFRCEGDHRFSLSPQKLGNGSRMEFSDHGNCCNKSLERKHTSRSSEQNCNKNSPEALSELTDVELSVTSGESADIHFKIRDPLSLSSELMTSEEEEKDPLEQMYATRNGDSKDHYDGFTSIKSSQTPVGVDSYRRLDNQARLTNGVQGQINTSAGSVSSSLNKAAKDPQPLVLNESEDLHTKQGNLSNQNSNTRH